MNDEIGRDETGVDLTGEGMPRTQQPVPEGLPSVDIPGGQWHSNEGTSFGDEGLSPLSPYTPPSVEIQPNDTTDKESENLPPTDAEDNKSEKEILSEKDRQLIENLGRIVEQQGQMIDDLQRANVELENSLKKMELYMGSIEKLSSQLSNTELLQQLLNAVRQNNELRTRTGH